MKKFTVLYFAPIEEQKKMAEKNPAEIIEGMKPWLDWQEKVGDALVEMGAPLINGKKITKSGVSDSEKEVAGYSVLQAESIDEVSTLLENHPHLEMMDDAEIEVYEQFPLPGMG